MSSPTSPEEPAEPELIEALPDFGADSADDRVGDPADDSAEAPAAGVADVPEFVPAEETSAQPSPHEPGSRWHLDPVTVTGLAVVLLALAGISAMVGGHFLLGGLRLAAGVLAGAGAGAGLVALLGTRRRSLPVRASAMILAVLLTLALTVPGILSHRVGPLERHATAVLAAVTEADLVASAPVPDSPLLIRRASGSSELVRGERVDRLEVAQEDVLALSADGRYLLHVHASAGESSDGGARDGGSSDGGSSDQDGEPSTEVFDLADASAPPRLVAQLAGAPLALAGEIAVMRVCSEGICRLSGLDLTAEPAAPEQADAEQADGESAQEPAAALWTVTHGSQEDPAHGPDPVGTAVPARAEEPPGLLDAARATGLLPAVPLKHDTAQGWVQLDPTTGFPLGRVLAGPEAPCRIGATAPPPSGPSLQEAAPTVLTACTDEEGAVTVTAFAEGRELWTSEPSPAGEWTLRLEAGRVLATGTETGTEVTGEIVASEQQAAWSSPGGEALADAATFTTRLGIDGARMVVTNEIGQLVAYDTATGRNTWTLAVTRSEGMRGDLSAGTVVVLDATARTASLQPRSAQRLRVIEAATGEVTGQWQTAEQIDAVRGVGAGRALVTTGERTLLLGA